MRLWAARAMVAICAAALAACSSSGNAADLVRHSAAPCTPPPGGRCAGPEPVHVALYGGALAVSKDGRTIAGRFQCGGRLKAAETASRVTLTYIASRVGPGAMACALVPLSVRLDAPVGSRTVVDGVTGQHLHVVHWPHAMK